MNVRVLLQLSAVVVLAACAAAPASSHLSDGDVAAIRALQAKFIANAQVSAWNALPTFFTDDATLIHAHEPAVRGIEAIREHYRNLKLHVVEAKARPVVIDGAGDVAYLRGTYEGVFHVGEGKPVADRGAFIWVLRKQNDGIWKIAEAASITLSAPASTAMTAQDRAVVDVEVRDRLRRYGEAVTSKNLDAMLGFWSSSEDFLFAGDGKILGGYDKWAPLTSQHNAETARWLSWNWRNVNVLPLARDAASATLEFDYSKISTKGDTVRGHGAWTYVFTKRDGTWKVVQTNGTHLSQ